MRSRNYEIVPHTVEPKRDEFLANVFPRRGARCWEWRGSMGGGCSQSPMLHVSERSYQARRLALYFFSGRVVDPSFNVETTCDNLRCVNPSHTRLVPAKRGRLPRAEGPLGVEKLARENEASFL